MREPITIVGFFAHPDDEILGPGGTLAQAAAGGARVVLVYTTRGEAGEIAAPELATKETLGQVREAEMRCAANALGVSELIFLGYRDSGMAGSAENQHPQAYINAPAGEVIPQLVTIIRQYQPQIVLTFEPFGGYGHPDHIAIHQQTVAAFHAAGDATAYPASGPAWQPQRLFYPLLPIFMFEALRDRIAAHGGDVSSFKLDERREKGWPDDQIHVFSDIGDHVAAKFTAWNCHRTQFGPGSRFRALPEVEMMQLLGREYFAQAWPIPTYDQRKTSLLADLSN